jgi:hypothetical protein
MKRRGHDAGEENSDEDRCLHHPRMVRAADQECLAHWNHGFVSVEGVVTRVDVDLDGIIDCCDSSSLADAQTSRVRFISDAKISSIDCPRGEMCDEHAYSTHRSTSSYTRRGSLLGSAASARRNCWMLRVRGITIPTSVAKKSWACQMLVSSTPRADPRVAAGSIRRRKYWDSGLDSFEMRNRHGVRMCNARQKERGGDEAVEFRRDEPAAVIVGVDRYDE